MYLRKKMIVLSVVLMEFGSLELRIVNNNINVKGVVVDLY